MYIYKETHIHYMEYIHYIYMQQIGLQSHITVLKLILDLSSMS